MWNIRKVNRERVQMHAKSIEFEILLTLWQHIYTCSYYHKTPKPFQCRNNAPWQSVQTKTRRRLWRPIRVFTLYLNFKLCVNQTALTCIQFPFWFDLFSQVTCTLHLKISAERVNKETATLLVMCSFTKDGQESQWTPMSPQSFKQVQYRCRRVAEKDPHSSAQATPWLQNDWSAKGRRGILSQRHCSRIDDQ